MTARRMLLPALLLLAPASIALALAAGSVTLGPIELWRVLTGRETGLDAVIVLELRLPRVLGAFAVGGLLALAGVLLQVLLRNPLADPYILGISGGAAAAALLAILFGLGAVFVKLGAFLGSLVSMFLVFGLSHARGTWTQTRLLLTGVMVASGWGALISFLLAVSPNQALPGMLFWLMGDLAQADEPLWGALVLLAGLLACLPLARALNVLARGERLAAALGENVNVLRLLLYFLASLLTAVAVALAGSVGFVGLVIPHILRQLGGADHRGLLVHAVLLGGSFLVAADTLARTLLAPAQLPVGVLTALLGVPVFLYLLARGARPFA